MKKGFTLIEVIVVASIIALLASIGLATYTGAQKKSRDAVRQGNLESVRQALELYRADNPTIGYPVTAGADNYAKFVNLGTPLSVYISPLPVDPRNTGTYRYSYTGGGTTYTLQADLEVLTPDPYQLTPP